MVARAEAQERRSAMLQMGQHQLTRGTVLQLDGAARLRIDQLGVHEAARAEVHAVLLLALSPERRADVADAHRLRDLRAPALLEPRPEGRLASSRLARDEDASDARAAEVEAAPLRPLDRVGRIRRRERRRRRPQELDREHQPIGVPDADRDVADAGAIERGERSARDERTRGVGRDEALAGGDAGRRVAPRRTRSPSSRGRPRSAGCSSASPSCRSSSRCARSRRARRRGGRRTDCPACSSP